MRKLLNIFGALALFGLFSGPAAASCSGDFLPGAVCANFGSGSAIPGPVVLGTNVSAWLLAPSSANLAAAVTDETGTGGLVLANGPTLVAPHLGTPADGVGTNITGVNAAQLNGATFASPGTIGSVTPGIGTFSQVIMPTSPMLIGLTTALTNGNLIYASIQNSGVSTGGLVGGNYAAIQNSNDASTSGYATYKSRCVTSHGCLGSAVHNGDDLGEMNANGDDGTNFVDVGSIDFVACGTVSTGIIPSCFSTWLMNSSGVQINAMMQSATRTTLYGSDYFAGDVFTVNGQTTINGTFYGVNQILSISPTGGVGYGTGAGGTVTQTTSKATAVTLNKAAGQITMNAAALAAGTIVSFTLTDSAIAATDVLVLNHISGGTVGSYTLNAQAAAGAATINVRNATGGSLSEAIVIEFTVIKGVTS